MFNDTMNVLNELAETSSSKEKIELLKNALDENIPNLELVIKYALNSDLHYNMKKLPAVEEAMEFDTEALHVEAIFDGLDYLAKKTGASNDDKQGLANLVGHDENARAIVTKIITKDLKCGINAKSANKAKAHMVNIWPYMRCQSFTKKNMGRLRYPCLAEIKADGVHIDIVVRGEKVEYRSRNGKLIELFGYPDDFFVELCGGVEEFVIIGEGVVFVDGTMLDRKTGNGIINKAIKGTITKEEAANIKFFVWDVIPYKNFMVGSCSSHNIERFEALKDAMDDTTREFEGRDGHVHAMLIPHDIVANEDEVMEYYRNVRREGEEGLIIKNYNGVFKNHTSPDQIKVKAEFDAEFRIMGWELGAVDSKYEDCLGALRCASSCGGVQFKVGSGFSDEQRGWDWEKYIGKVITVRFESLIIDKKRDTYSLFLPRFIELREDKNEADSLDYIQELTDMR